ncbi:1-(5-phosphoribosyl)-5-[(5-phosphoribosylamino)methylideneamino]imidazole-4-carboxamide isomerase [Thermogemmatispora sp.]|uniref:1-(5-phosphoribosyl)-5-[(5- phosphoribosylamino)methylideneamino]imidazole-4- carboxamide isomerase n=1 Tax=Thermogemmatispora sp. TaxID=1968838 RepID=UPI001D95BEBE|nr:1-(5-phosphoribosyl)-5-[(5-phosphoribosylamino)methylideneamino]imidazole-4-carboxamide isomerase [Thermogemmatispora sp.]MBX5448468.1 1-(5-phosphoribosyl)-5-[(5-phosphoribosylamino)methylideneamino]imidazole-4-carboxamide isomerase [Thermogemmatispora sp.]
MIILPAIDLREGRCVRLYQGDYHQTTVYSHDPVAVARRWQEAGARWLHLVDLDGAAQGQPVNLNTVERIRAATTLQIELGGGLRDLASIERVLALGINRVVLGTSAVRQPALLAEAIQRWGERIVVGLDARDGLVAVAGWQQTERIAAVELAARLCELGVARFIYTDIARDGTLSGPNLEALQAMLQVVRQAQPPRALIASGGVRALEDIRALARLGVEGVIIGKALYTGDVDLAAALACAAACEPSTEDAD